MKKQVLLVAVALACTSAFAGTAAQEAAALKELSASDVKTDLVGFETVTFGGQEIRLAVTTKTARGRGAHAYCRQYVQTYSHELTPVDMQDGGAAVAVDKTTITLGNACHWVKD